MIISPEDAARWGQHGIYIPGPILGSAAPVLNPDGADLDLRAIVFPDDAIILVRLGMDHFAKMRIHLGGIGIAAG
jgi:hypothetical protein